MNDADIFSKWARLPEWEKQARSFGANKNAIQVVKNGPSERAHPRHAAKWARPEHLASHASTQPTNRRGNRRTDDGPNPPAAAGAVAAVR